MSKAYKNNIHATEEDLCPLMGCVLIDISEGAGEDGKEFATLEFYNPGSHKYIRMSIREDSVLSLSDFENQ